MDSVIDFSKLEGLVKSLNDSLGPVGVKLSVATAAVVIGLLIEYADDIREGVTALRKDIQGRSPFLNVRSLDSKVKRTLLGGLLVTGGVAFELVYEYNASVIEGQLQSANGQIVAFLNAKAHDAEVTTGQLDAANKQLAINLERQKQTTAGVEKEAAALQKLAEDEKIERLRLSESIAWRTPDLGLINGLYH